MSDFQILLLSYVAFFVPVAGYLFVLAQVNRRINPVMVTGTWDAIGLMLACTGALLVCGPVIIYVQFDRSSLIALDAPRAKDVPPKADAEEDAEGVKQEDELTPWKVFWRIVWGTYYVLILGGAGLLIWSRGNKTIVYNVDADQFDLVLARVLAKRQLAQTRVGRTVFIGPREISGDPQAGPSTEFIADRTAIQPAESPAAAVVSVPDYGRLAQVDIDPFPAMCHVTLTWRYGATDLRHEVDDELRRNLDECRTLENPAAGWFLGLSTLLFFLVIAVITFMVLVILVPPRGR